MDAAAVWTAVADERRALASEVAGLAADALDRPSRCAGWRVRDVLGHLVWLAERSRRQLLLDGARTHPNPQRAVDRIARRTGAADAATLAARLDAAATGQGRGPFLPPAAALGEVRAHRADIAAAVGLAPGPADEGLQAVLELYRGLWWVFRVPRRVRQLRVQPDGAGWFVGPADGPLLAGAADQVLLAVTGRGGDVTGPGAEVLAR